VGQRRTQRHELCEWTDEGGNMTKHMSRWLLIFVFIITAAIIVVEVGAADDGLVAEWNFEEGSGNTLKDNSGNGNDGTIYGATWTTDGKFGSALQFDGVNDYVEIPDSPELSGGTGKNKTVEFWFNSNKQGGHIITKWKDVSYKDWGTSIGAVGPGLFFWYENRGYDRRFYGGTIEEGVWHHGAFAFERSTGSNNAKVTLYLDGEELDVINFDGVAPDRLYDMPDTTAPVSIGYSGKYYNNGFFDGKIDEIKIYNRVLSADEIKAEYDKKRVFFNIWNVDGKCGIHSGTQFNDRIAGWSNAYTGSETDEYERAAKYLDQEGIDTVNIVAHVRGGGDWGPQIKNLLDAIDHKGVGIKIILDLEPEPTWSQQDVLNNIDTTINIAKKPDGEFYPTVVGISLDMEYLGGTGSGTDTLEKIQKKIVNDNSPLKFFPIWFGDDDRDYLKNIVNKEGVIPLYDGLVTKDTPTDNGINDYIRNNVKFMKENGFTHAGVMPISLETGSIVEKQKVAYKTWFIYKDAVNNAGGADYFLLGSGLATEDPLSIYFLLPSEILSPVVGPLQVVDSLEKCPTTSISE